MGAELDHRRIIAQIVRTALNETPRDIRRMTAGIANDVYCARLAARDVIVRLNANSESMRGAEAHIALFKSLGIKAPEMLAADYSQSLVPFAYQIESKLEGQDIGQVIASLTGAELRTIAAEIAGIYRKLAPLPTNGRFGWAGGDKQATFDTWLAVLRNLQTEIADRTASTGTVKPEYLQAISFLLARHQDYFQHIPSTFYYDDMSSKNVLINHGKFAGVVDLDTVAYGDPLEGVGRIEASWYGAEYGRTYADAVMNEMRLTPRQRTMVSVYGALNRIYWLSERGVKFNENTSTLINDDDVKRDESVIDSMLAMLDIS